MRTRLNAHTLIPGCFLLILMLQTGAAWGAGDENLSDGQTLYVPVYSHIYYGDRTKPFNLAVMLSIRNTDPGYPLTIVTATYYDSDGTLVREYVQKPLELKPLASTHLYVKESDTSGGSGANFIVTWKAARPINVPIVESLMIGVSSGQGISFVREGQVIRQHD